MERPPHDERNPVKKAFAPYLASAALLTLLCGLLFHRILFLAVVPGSPDSVTPMALSIALDALRERTGLYPLWQPWTFSGMPTVEAFSYLSGLYLPNVLFSLLHVDPLHVQLLHLIFAGIGGFVLCRRLGLNDAASLLAGSAFMLNPFLTAMLAYGHGSQLMTAAYMPWAIWAALRLSGSSRIRDAGLLALMLGLQLLRAHVQIAYYTWMLVVPLLALRFLLPPAGGKSPATWKPPLLSALALGLAVAMALQIYLPAHDYLPFSARSGGDPGSAYRYATLWSMHPAELLTYLLPGAFGFGGEPYWGFMPFTDFPHYAGLVVLGLSIAGFLRNRRDPIVLFFAAAAFLALLLSFGRHFSPVYDLFYHFAPLFSSFRVPSMALVIVALCVPILAGFGLHSFSERPPKAASPLLKWGSIAIALAAILVLFSDGGIEPLVRSNFPAPKVADPDIASLIDAVRWGLWRGSLALFVVIACASASIAWLTARGTLAPARAALILVAIACADLLWLDHRIVSPDERSLRPSPLVQRETLREALSGDEITAFLAARPGTFRIYPAGPLFPENKFSIAGIESTGGYHAAKLGVYEALLARTDNLLNIDILRLLNVGYIVSPVPVDDPALIPVKAGMLRLVTGEQPVAVYRLSGAMPRAWFAREARSAASSGAAIDSVMAGGSLAARTVWTTGGPWQGSRRFAEGRILSFSRSAESMTITADADGDALLVVSEVYYPRRWKLSVDGKGGDALRVDGAIRGVQVPKGTHTVRFTYDRSLFDRGRAASMAAIAASILMAAGGPLSGALSSRRKSTKTRQ